MTLFIVLKDRAVGTEVLVNVEHIAAVVDEVEMNRAREVVTYFDGQPRVIGATITLANGTALPVQEAAAQIRSKMDQAALREIGAQQ